MASCHEVCTADQWHHDRSVDPIVQHLPRHGRCHLELESFPVNTKGPVGGLELGRGLVSYNPQKKGILIGG